MLPRKAIAILAALVLGPLVLSACGSSTPTRLSPSAAVSVGGHVLSKATVRHWMSIGAHQIGGAGGLVPDAPSFTNCIADGKIQNKAQKHAAILSDAQLRTQCQKAYDSLLGQALSVLVAEQWLEETAPAHGASVSQGEVESAFAKERKTAFPKTSSFDAYLASSGMTQGDILLRIREQLLAQKLQQEIYARAAPVSSAEIAAYSSAHPTSTAASVKATIAAQHQSAVWQQFLSHWRAANKAHTLCGAAFYDATICGQRLK